LEGSVRKTGDKVRITAQLVDALSGRHIFSERYDRDFKEILTVQDEITMSILVPLQVTLTKGEMARIAAKGTKNLEAYLKYLKAHQLSQQYNKEALATARGYAEECIALDPGYAMGYRALTQVIGGELFIGSNKLPRAAALQQALELAQKAVTLDPSSSQTHSGLGFIYYRLQQPEKALLEAEQAIALSPNDASAYDCMGAALFAFERYQDAISMYQKSLRLSPVPTSSTGLLMSGAAYRFIGQNAEAIATFKRLLQFYPDNLFGHAYLAATYASAGRDPEAHAQAAEVYKIDPNFSVEGFIKRFTVKNKTLLDQMVADLRKAGLK
jgi:adenylate cyclase